MAKEPVWRWHSISLLSSFCSLPLSPCLDSTHLLLLETYLTTGVRHEHHSIRRKMYSFILRSLPHLTSYSEVPLSSSLRFLRLFPATHIAPSSSSLSNNNNNNVLTTVHKEFSLNSQAVNTWLFTLFSKSNSTLQAELANTIAEFIKTGNLQKDQNDPHLDTANLQQSQRIASTIARAMLFLQTEVLSTTLEPLVETLAGIYSRPYLAHGAAERSLALLVAILSSPLSQESRGVITSLIVPVIPEVVAYVQIHITSFTSQLTTPIDTSSSQTTDATSSSDFDESDRADILASALGQLTPYAAFSAQGMSILQTIVTNLQKISAFLVNCVAAQGGSALADSLRAEFAKGTAAQYLAAMGPSLRTPGLFTNDQEIQEFASQAASSLIASRLRRPTRAATTELEARNWNRVVASHSHHVWVAASHLAELASLGKGVSREIVDNVEDALEVAISTTVGPILRTLRISLSSDTIQIDRDELTEKMGRILSQAWRVAMEDEGFHSFASVLQEAFHPDLLRKFPEFSADATSPLRVLFQEALVEGETVMGVVNLLVSLCCTVWFGNPNDNSIALLYLEEMLGLMTFGPIRKGDNSDLDLSEDLTICRLDDESLYGPLPDVPTQDSFGRALLVSYLSKYVLNETEEAKEFTGQLISTLLEINATHEYSRKSDYMVNSLVHRKRIRLWQFTCVLAPRIPSNYGEEVKSRIWKILENPNLLSVRRYINIFVINWLSKFPFYLNGFLIYLKQINLRADSVSSGIVIAGHLVMGQKLEKDVAREIFFGLIQYSTSNHVTIRCVAQSMIQIISENKELLREYYPDLGTVDTFSYLSSISWYLHNNQECAKNLKKQYAHLSGLLDGRTNCSLSNLFFDIPVLEELNSSDVIPPNVFEEMVNNTPVLVGSNWIVPKREDLQLTSDILVPTGDVSGLNFQKKILPWSNIELDNELSRTIVRTKKRQNLILVASLIDKIPNLAGMTRTSEIFNIEALAVPNKKVENELLFQQISVTAEKWVPLIEVKEEDLMTFLMEKKNEGYCLLGVEQTAQSTNLPDFTFPEKSVLLMGREKEGIPTEYINILDKCIEIPQLGVVRSLNVHVSASILVWEYTRQQMMKNK